MKSKGLIIFLIILLSIIAITITGFLIIALNSKFRFFNLPFNYKVMEELIIDEVYENHYRNINIDADASDIEFIVSETNEVRVKIYGKKENNRIEDNNDSLKIVSKEKVCKGLCFNINVKVSKVEVYLPENYNGKINIVNKYGDINIANFKDAEINIDEDCGDVKIDKANIINVNNNYGDIDINEANSINIEEDCGDVKVGTVSDAVIKNSYGDIKISKVNNYLNIENDCGDIKIDTINLQESSYIQDNLGDIEIGKTNEIYIDASTDLGKVKVNNNYNKSDITLKIENDCGDIKVNN